LDGMAGLLARRAARRRAQNQACLLSRHLRL
jgi:hypothetical protein